MEKFIVELIARLFSSTPWFMRVVRNVAIVLAVITGLPAFLASSGIDLPDSIDVIASKVVGIASVISAFIAQLAVPNDTNEKPE